MRRAIVTFEEEDVREKAQGYFIKYSGLDLSKEKHKRMYKDAVKVWEAGLEGISLSALISSYGPEAYTDQKIAIDGNEIRCQAFSQIPDSNVLALYLYLITAGECLCNSEKPISNQLYADIWGTAYVDAGRDHLEELIRRDAEDKLKKRPGIEGCLSIPISPGFFGMTTEESKTISAILSGQDMGITVKDNGVMLPLKSCSGIYLVVRDLSKMPLAGCKNCIGNPGGCKLCRLMSQNGKRE